MKKTALYSIRNSTVARLMLIAATLTLVSCGGGGQGPECSRDGIGIRCRFFTDVFQYEPMYVDTFDAGITSMSVTTSNAILYGDGGQAVVELFLNHAPVASSVFAYTRNGNTLSFSDPTAVTAWVQANGQNINGFRVGIADIAALSQPGGNSVTVEALYSSTLIHGGTHGWYHHPLYGPDLPFN